MTGRAQARLVAVMMVVFSALNIALLMYLTDGADVPIRLTRFTLTCILSIFLFIGSNIARIITVVLVFLAVLIAMIAIPFTASQTGWSSIFTIWMFAVFLFYGWVLYMLAFNREVTSFYKGSSGR